MHKYTTMFALVALHALSAPAMAASAEEELARSKNCLGCHAVNKKVMGPAFIDVAKKYGDQADAEAMLVHKVQKGSTGVWGSLSMPPMPVSDDEAATLVKWVLSQK